MSKPKPFEIFPECLCEKHYELHLEYKWTTFEMCETTSKPPISDERKNHNGNFLTVMWFSKNSSCKFSMAKSSSPDSACSHSLFWYCSSAINRDSGKPNTCNSLNLNSEN